LHNATQSLLIRQTTRFFQSLDDSTNLSDTPSSKHQQLPAADYAVPLRWKRIPIPTARKMASRVPRVQARKKKDRFNNILKICFETDENQIPANSISHIDEVFTCQRDLYPQTVYETI
jgi:hypothetical protein